MLLIHRHRRRVIDKYGEFNTVDAQPVVAHIDHGAHERAGDAAILPAGIDANTEVGDVAAARALGNGNTEVPNHLFIDAGDQLFDARLVG